MSQFLTDHGVIVALVCALCAVALGRKNWLFAGSDDGGERAANIYSLLGTTRLNDINPETYLR